MGFRGWLWARIYAVKVHPLYRVLREMACSHIGHKPTANGVHCRRCFKVLKDF